MRSVQPQARRQSTDTTTRTTTHILMVIDWAPTFLPALILCALGFRWGTEFVVTF
jgi:hypothetical protein